MFLLRIFIVSNFSSKCSLKRFKTPRMPDNFSKVYLKCYTGEFVAADADFYHLLQFFQNWFRRFFNITFIREV